VHHDFYAATICVKKKDLYGAVKTLQKVRGRHVGGMGRHVGGMWAHMNYMKYVKM
jgi:hypothetical protein